MKYSKERVLKALVFDDVICWGDLYETLGIAECLLALGKYDVKYILASADFQQTVNEKLKENILKSKDKRVKLYRKEARLKMWNWDCVCFSPTTAKIEDGIKITLDL